MGYNKTLFQELMDLQDDALGYQDTRDLEKEKIDRYYKTNGDLLKEAKYILDTFYESGHMNCEDLKESNIKEWRSLTMRARNLIRKIEKAIKEES